MTLSYPSYQPEEFVKLTNADNINRDFQYKEGLNEDVYDLNEMVECDKGGLYFSRFKDIMKWTHPYGNCNIWRVIIPESEKVIEYNDKLKAKRIILTDCQQMYNNPELCKLAVQQNENAFVYINNQTPEICKLAVQQDGSALQYVKKQTPELCKLAVQQNGLALEYVKEQTPEICKLAVQKIGYALRYVREQTPEVCKIAVQQNGYALHFVKERTPEICKLAVRQNGCALEYVKEQTPEICKLAVQQNPDAIKYVKNPEWVNEE